MNEAVEDLREKCNEPANSIFDIAVSQDVHCMGPVTESKIQLTRTVEVWCGYDAVVDFNIERKAVF